MSDRTLKYPSDNGKSKLRIYKNGHGTTCCAGNVSVFNSKDNSYFSKRKEHKTKPDIG